MRKITFLLLVCLLATLTLNAQSTKVLMKTTMGDITMELYDDTPMHKENFIKLINEKFFEGLLFHRVMNTFMIQTGDPDSKNAEAGTMLGSGGPGYKIPAEIRPDRWHKKGSLAAARQNDKVNPNKESSGSQFYIVQGKKWSANQLKNLDSRRAKKFTEEQKKHYSEVGGYPPLDFEYTVFGEVIKGLDIVDKIAAVEVNKPSNRPVKDVKILSMKIIK